MDRSLNEESSVWPNSDDEGNTPSDKNEPVAGLKRLMLAGDHEELLFEDTNSTDVQSSLKQLPHRMLTNSDASTRLLLANSDGNYPRLLELPAKVSEDNALLFSDSVTSEHSNLQLLSPKLPKWMSHVKEIKHISDTSLL